MEPPKEDTTEKILQATCENLKIIEKESLTDNDSKTIVETKLVVKIEEHEQRSNSSKDADDCETDSREHGKLEEETEEEEDDAKREKASGVVVTADDDKECSSIISAISNEEISIISEIADNKSFCPRKNSDGEDINGHIGHIDSPETDTYPNSEALHGESIVDDISSMLGNDLCGYDSMENTYTDDTTLFANEFADLKMEKRRSLKRDSLERIRRSSRHKIDEDAQFGFENRAFISQHMLESEPKYCSLAQFVEGNDIARKSFKRVRPSTKLTKMETNVNRQSTLTEESEGSARGSRTSLNKIEKELSNLKETERLEGEKAATVEDVPKFPQVSVIVEPPSPDLNEQIRCERMEKLSVEIEMGSDYDLRHMLSKSELLSTSDVTTSNNSSNSNLLGIDNEHFLSCSPAATRRISCCSMLNPNEAAALAAAAAATTSFYSDLEKREKRDDKEKEKRKLPIINPLVRLPTWPSKILCNRVDQFVPVPT